MIHKRISTIFAVICVYCYVETQSMVTAASVSSENWQNGDWTDDPIFKVGSRAKRNNTTSNLPGSMDSLSKVSKPDGNLTPDHHSVKVMDPQKAATETEILVLERLSHPDVKSAFIVVEAVPDREYLKEIPGISHFPANKPVTLTAFLKHYGKLTERLAMLIVVQIIRAVNDLHQQGILWGNVTCDNFVFMENWRLKAMNFGKAEVCNDKSNCKSTKPKDGAWEYAAPEVISVTDSKPYGFEADWWSVGIILYKILFGEFPFGNDPRTNVAKYAKVHPEYVISFPTDHINVSGDGVSLIKGFLIRDPTMRVGSMTRHTQVHAGHTEPHHNPAAHSNPLYESEGKEIMEKEHWFKAAGLLNAHEVIDLATKNRDLTIFVTEQLRDSSAKATYEDARHKTAEKTPQLPEGKSLKRKEGISDFAEHIEKAPETV